MSTIGIISANLGRIKVLEIFCAGIKRLREETQMDIPCVVVGDIDGRETCERYNIQHIEYPNKPLTGKFNRACLEMKGKVDACMVMGSDNLIATETFLRIHAEVEKGIDLIGLNDLYFFGMDDIYTGKLIYFGHTTVLGVGRTVSAKVLGQVGWEPWKIDRDRGIDTVMLDGVRSHVKTSVLLKGGFVVDIKSSWNLNRLDFWYKKLGALPNADMLWKNIGNEESELIRDYISKQ